MTGRAGTGAGLLVAGGAVFAAGLVGGLWPCLIGGGVMVVFGANLLSLPVLAAYHRWAQPRFLWWHQVAQLALCVGAAAVLWWRGAGWWGVAVVVALSFLMALSAGAEGRTTGARMERAAEALRREESEPEFWYGDDVPPPWERDDLGLQINPADPENRGPGLPKMPGDGNTY